MIFIQALLALLLNVLEIYTWIVIISALISWVKPDPDNAIVQILYKLTEPVYAKMRQFFPTGFSGMDFAPVILLLALYFVKTLLLLFMRTL